MFKKCALYIYYGSDLKSTTDQLSEWLSYDIHFETSRVWTETELHLIDKSLRDPSERSEVDP